MPNVKMLILKKRKVSDKTTPRSQRKKVRVESEMKHSHKAFKIITSGAGGSAAGSVGVPEDTEEVFMFATFRNYMESDMKKIVANFVIGIAEKVKENTTNIVNLAKRSFRYRASSHSREIKRNNNKHPC